MRHCYQTTPFRLGFKEAISVLFSPTKHGNEWEKRNPLLWNGLPPVHADPLARALLSSDLNTSSHFSSLSCSSEYSAPFIEPANDPYLPAPTSNTRWCSSSVIFYIIRIRQTLRRWAHTETVGLRGEPYSDVSSELSIFPCDKFVDPPPDPLGAPRDQPPSEDFIRAFRKREREPRDGK